MRLNRLTISNYRSIKKIENLRIEPLQGFVGENNAGKSNILRALDSFLSAGAGGITLSDFHTSAEPIVIEAEFDGLAEAERKRLRSYLIGGRIILQKRLTIVEERGKKKVQPEYHGYQAEPTEWFLSVGKIQAQEGAKPKWKEIAEANGLLEYVKTTDGKVNKTSYTIGVERYLLEHDDVAYDEPQLGQTQALGIPQNLLSALPEMYLLHAITDYSDEIDRRSSSTVFRRLMADLSDRLMRADPRYVEVEHALNTLRRLLNPPAQGEESQRLPALESVEVTLRDTIKELMPSVLGVQLAVDVEEPREVFAKGVAIRVDDGVVTDVLDKGHGMQRCIVFALLQMLVKVTLPP